MLPVKNSFFCVQSTRAFQHHQQQQQHHAEDQPAHNWCFLFCHNLRQLLKNIWSNGRNEIFENCKKLTEQRKKSNEEKTGWSYSESSASTTSLSSLPTSTSTSTSSSSPSRLQSKRLWSISSSVQLKLKKINLLQPKHISKKKSFPSIPSLFSSGAQRSSQRWNGHK